MVRLRSPRQFGQNLRNFAEVELFDLLSGYVCGNCTMPSHEDACDDCEAFAILGHIENQIGDAGIEFMKKLVQKWKSVK